MKYSCGPLLAALAWGIEDVGPEFGAGDCAACAHADSLSGFGAWEEAAPLCRLRESGSPGGKSFRRIAAPTNLSEVSWDSSSGHW